MRFFTSKFTFVGKFSIIKALLFAIIILANVSVSRAQIQSSGNGDWFSGSTWIGGIVPGPSDQVEIQANHFVYTNGTVTRDALTTVNGWFELRNGGGANGTVNMTYSSSQGGLVFSHTGYTFPVGSTNTFWPVANGPFNLTLNTDALVALQTSLSGSRTIAGTATLSSGLISDYASAFGISGTLILNTNGFTGNNSPQYFNGSTLQYNTAGTYGQNIEWSSNNTSGAGIGTPSNVRISNNTNVSLSGSADQYAFGNITIDNGSTLTCNDRLLFVSGNVNVAGTLNLNLKDINVGGNLSFTAGYTLNNNNKAFFFTGVTTPQTISLIGMAVAPTLHYVLLTGSSVVQLNTDLNVSAPTGGNFINFNHAGNIVNLNGRSLTLGTAGQAATIFGVGSFSGSTSSSLRINSSVATPVPLRFTTGFQELSQLTLDLTAADASLLTPLSVGTLNLTNGSIDIGANNLTITGPGPVLGASAARYIKTTDAGLVRKIFSAAGNFTFPIGRANYTPGTVTVTSGTFAGGASVSMNVVNTVHPTIATGPTVKINRYWNTASTGITNYVATLVFNYLATDVTGVGAEASMKGAGYNGVNWATSALVNVGAKTFTVPNISEIRSAYTAADVFSPMVSTDYYQTTPAASTWSNPLSWETSPTGVGPWTPAVTAPDATANTITIRGGHTISVATSRTFDQLVVNGTLVVNAGGVLNILDGPGVDMAISGTGMLQILKDATYASTIIQAATASVSVASPTVAGGGKIMIGNGGALNLATGYEVLAVNTNNSWANSSIYEHNNLSNITTTAIVPFIPNFFPNAGAGIPIFRVQRMTGNFGSAITVTVNGLMEINTGFTVAVASGSKNFRNGFSGTGIITFSAGTTNISGSPAILAGSLTLNINQTLNIDAGITIPSGSNILVSNTSNRHIVLPFFTGGQTFSVAAGASFDIGNFTTFAGSNAANTIEVLGTLKTGNTAGFGVTTGSYIKVLGVGSTIEYNGTAPQTLTNDAYYNLTISGNRVTGGTTNMVAAGTVSIINAAILDATSNILPLPPAVNTKNLTMSGTARFILRTTDTQPLMTGTYNLAGNSVIEFANTNATAQTIRNTATYPYQNIEVSGSSVGNSSGNILLKANGSFRVLNGGIFTINANSIQAVTATTGQSLIVDAGGTFKVGNAEGFNGTTNTAVDVSISNISLHANSTVEYSRLGAQPITNANSLVYGAITLSGSGVKTAPAPAQGILELRGGFTDNITPSTFAHSSGVVRFSNGALAQSYSSAAGSNTSFFDLQTNNSSSFIMTSDATVENELKLISAATRMQINGSIILKSTPTRTARVDEIISGTPPFSYGGSGGFSVERYLPGYNSWRLLSVPLVNGTAPSIFDSWQEAGTSTPGYGVQISSNLAPTVANGFDYQTTFPALKIYNPATNVYDPVLNTKTTLMGNERGYYVFVRGDRLQGQGSGGFVPTTLRVKGQINTLTIPAINIPSAAFATIANPYPSRVAFQRVSKTNITDAYVSWNPGLWGAFGVGGFETWTWDVGTSSYRNTANTASKDFLESGEAVFVQNLSGTAGSVLFEENDKNVGSSIYSRTGANEPALRLRLHTTLPTGEEFIPTAALINFDDSYSNGQDNNDVRRFLNSIENLSVLNASNLLAVERRKMVTAADTIYLSLTRTQQKAYKLQMQASNIIAPGLEAYLVDRFTNTQNLFSLNDSTFYPFNVTADAASYAANRFYIIFKQGVVLPVTFTSITATRNVDKTVAVSWKVESESSIKEYYVENSTDGINFEKIGTVAALNAGATSTYNFLHSTASSKVNFYRIRSVDLAASAKFSATAKVNAVLDGSTVQIVPNPVRAGVINIVSNLEIGRYAVRLIDAKGSVVLSSSITQNAGTASNTIKVGNVPTGIYQLVLVDANNKVTSTKVIIE